MNGKVTNRGREHNARQREYHVQVMGLQEGPEPTVRAEHQDENHPGNHRRHGERQVDQCDQPALTAKIEFCDCP